MIIQAANQVSAPLACRGRAQKVTMGFGLALEAAAATVLHNLLPPFTQFTLAFAAAACWKINPRWAGPKPGQSEPNSGAVPVRRLSDLRLDVSCAALLGRFLPKLEPSADITLRRRGFSLFHNSTPLTDRPTQTHLCAGVIGYL